MTALREAIFNILEASHPMTDRQVFYQMTTNGYVAKTEAQCKGTVVAEELANP
jgi:hypothetical protein